METPDGDSVELKDMYSEVGQAWRNFLGWREKIIAGYVTSIAAIATAIHVSEGDQVGLLVSAVLVSGVFWIFDFRNRLLMGVCQQAGESIEEALRPNASPNTRGCYSALMALRRAGAGPWCTGWLTHGLAVDVLVSGIVTAATGRLLALHSGSSSFALRSGLEGIAFFVTVVALFQLVGVIGRLSEQTLNAKRSQRD